MTRATKRKAFSSLMEESDWWDQLSLEDLIAMSEPDDEDIKFVDARPKKAISLRLNESLIIEGKRIAGDLGIGYQTLFRMWLLEGLRHHRGRKRERAAPVRRTGARKALTPATRA